MAAASAYLTFIRYRSETAIYSMMSMMSPFSWLFSGMIGDIQVSVSTVELNIEGEQSWAGSAHPRFPQAFQAGIGEDLNRSERRTQRIVSDEIGS